MGSVFQGNSAELVVNVSVTYGMYTIEQQKHRELCHFIVP